MPIVDVPYMHTVTHEHAVCKLNTRSSIACDSGQYNHSHSCKFTLT